mgnify:CR=1 FL=1
MTQNHFNSCCVILDFQRKLRNENEKRRRDLFSQLITNIGEIIFNNNQPIKLSKNAILRQTVTFLQEQRNCNSIQFNSIQLTLFLFQFRFAKRKQLSTK